MPPRIKDIKTLASVLARTYIAHAIDHSRDAGSPHELPIGHRKKLVDGSPLERVVVVVGAGASHSAGNLPLGARAGRLLRQRLAHIHPDLIEHEVERLTTEQRLNRNDFETGLLALSRFDLPALLQELERIFDRRYYPSLTYEILAHLLKHRFVDAIYNFNFDEILDQSIDDEIGSGNYYRVVSDGDCRQPLGDLARPSGDLRLPLYVKPHGTVSSKTSMRFTRGDYFHLPREIRDLTATLVRDLPLRLIVIGHAMNSFEFNKIIQDHGSRDVHVFVLSDKLTAGHQRLQRSLRPRTVYRFTPLLITARVGLDPTWRHVWHQIGRVLPSSFPRPRGIVRHELVAALFSHRMESDDPKPMSLEEEIEYVRDRAVVEVCLAVAKAKGFLHLRQLLESRAGRYYALYKRKSDKKGESLLRFCERIGLSIASGDALYLGLHRPDAKPGHNLIHTRHSFKAAQIGRLLRGSQGCLLGAERKTLLKQHEPLVRRALLEMYDGEEVEVTGGNPLFEHEFFADPIPLPTFASMQLATQKLLRTEWDLMLCVAETGEWLGGPMVSRLIRRGRRFVKVIVADKTRSRELRGRLNRGRIRLRVSWLRWWLHNQHMTICLREGRPLGAIFFERRLRSPAIAPVYLEPDDADRAIDKFVAYWLRSEGLARNGRDPFLDQPTIARERHRILTVAPVRVGTGRRDGLERPGLHAAGR